MRLRTFILADAVTVSADGKAFIHGGGVGRVYAQSFPWTQPQLAAFVTLVGEGEEPGSEHTLSLGFRGPRGQDLEARVDGDFKIPPRGRDDVEATINFTTQFIGAEFPEPGVYWLCLVFDGVELDRIPVSVVHADQRPPWMPLGG